MATTPTMKMDSAHHTRKRQYQPSITSFFHRNAATVHATARIPSPLSPPLPAETQASLLSVGMRVRKSVPEGYKTHKTLGTAGFPFPSNVPVVRLSTPDFDADHAVVSRELTPFCGLHKVGGWAEQASSSAPASFHIDGDDLVPELSRSQSTLYSSQGSFMATGLAGVDLEESKKRGYEEDVEEEMDAIFDELAAEEGDAKVRARVFAQPKSLLRRTRLGMVDVQQLDTDDFQDAPFLDPGEGMDVEDSQW